MKPDEFVARLANFGLDEREALAYYHLSRLGGASASRLAEVSELKRTEVYRLMESLVSRGFVEATLERPRRFVPMPIEDALDSALRARQARIESLLETKAALVDAWPRVPNDDAGAARFAVHQGRAQIQGLLQRMVEGAREEVLVVAVRRGLSRLDEMGLFDAIEANPTDGLAVRLLTQVDAANRPVAEAVERLAQVRHVDLPGYHQMVIVDNREVALFVSLDPVVSTSGVGETVLWLASPDLLLAQRSMFDLLWSTAVDLPARQRELDEGVIADQLAVVRGRWTRTDRVRQMLHRAERAVFLAVSEAECARLADSGLGGALERLAKAGTRVRLLCASGPLPALEGVEVRHGRSPFPGDLVLVDGREAVAVFGSSEEPGLLTSDQEWSVWVHRADELGRAAEALEALWDGAAEA